MITSIIGVLSLFIICLGCTLIFAQYKYNKYNRFVSEQKEVINNMIELLNARNKITNKFLVDYVYWLNNDFSKQSIELVVNDAFLTSMRDKYKIPTQEYVLAFQNILTELQNSNCVRVQELITNISNNMISVIRSQIQEK